MPEQGAGSGHERESGDVQRFEHECSVSELTFPPIADPFLIRDG